MSRAQLDHLLLDVDYFDKPKVKAVIFKFNPVAALFLIRIDLLLSRATNACIPRDAARGAAYELRIDAEVADKIIDFAISTDMLQGDSDTLTSARVAEDQEKLFRTREKWREKNEKKKGNSGVTPESTPGNTPIPVNTEQLNTEDLNDLDLKTNGAPQEPPIVFPPKLDTPECRKALDVWIRHSADIGKHLSQISIEAILLQYAEMPEEFIAHTLGSAGAKYRKIAPVSAKPPKQNPSSGAFEKVIGLVKTYGRNRREDAYDKLDHLEIAAIKTCGGWARFCDARGDDSSLKKAFCEALAK